MSELFTTNRLKIRRLVSTDFEAYFKMHSNPTVMNVIPAPIQNSEEARVDLNKCISSYEKLESRILVYAIVLKESQKFIGLIGIIHTSEQSKEIGYRLDECFWRKGYGSELVKGVIRYLFNHPKIETITADVTNTNVASIALLNKFMTKTNESFNEKDQCIDLHYSINKQLQETLLD
jgi:[ribosomal protein S5]-alanine N-acetyltransferase